VNWQINVPHRLRSDSLSNVAVAARALPTDEDRAVCRQLVLREITGGTAKTAGELLDKLEKASPSERRELLDRAREKAGLPTTGDVEFREEHERIQRNTRLAETRPSCFALNESGLIVDLAVVELERERAAAAEESRRRFLADREAERAVEGAEMREHERAQRERSRREMPPGIAA
jgi:hypothetical protein